MSVKSKMKVKWKHPKLAVRKPRAKPGELGVARGITPVAPVGGLTLDTGGSPDWTRIEGLIRETRDQLESMWRGSSSAGLELCRVVEAMIPKKGL